MTVDEGRFRAGLFYRLNVFPIHVPPLRERVEDIPLLVQYFGQQFASRMSRAIDIIPEDTMKALTRYSWPGNIRELQNVIERAVSLSPRSRLTCCASRSSRTDQPSRDGGKRRTLEQAERAHILATLEETRGVVAGPNGAATLLGINQSTL